MPAATASAAAGRQRNRRAATASRVLYKVLVYLVLLLGAVAFVVPFAWMLSTSLKSPAEVFIFPPRWIPAIPRWRNYIEALTVQPFGRYTINTAIVTGLCLVGTLVSCSTAAYGFARVRGAGSRVLFSVLLATMMLPSQVTMIPTFILFRYLGWVNTFKPLVVPSFFGGAFYIFLLRQYMMTISGEMDEAAAIDGCSPAGIFFRIVLPLCKPALATVAIFVFMSEWTDLMGPLIYLNSRRLFTISLGLASYRQQFETETPWHLLMAASVVTMAPTLLVFFSAQRLFIQGVVVSGLKG